MDRAVIEKPVVVKPATVPEKVPLKRRSFASEDQLRVELAKVPEVGLDKKVADQLRESISKLQHAAFVNDDPTAPPADIGIQTLEKLAEVQLRPEFIALPWQAPATRQLSIPAATVLQDNATDLLARLEHLPKNLRDDADLATLRTKLWGETADGKWEKAECVPAITQILQAQATPVRMLLVEQLAKIPGSSASEALAQRAIYDLSPQVREQAVAALKSRSGPEYQKVLLNGLRWPWRPVTEHSAEALVALQLKELAPQLVTMLQEPDPAQPFAKDHEGLDVMYVREVVKMKHTQNCLLCHPPSFAKEDKVRGVVPSFQQRFHSYSRKFFREDSVLVRADNTTLRQDFSVMQPGPPAANSTLPTDERYDYFIRERLATREEIKLHQERAKGERPGGPNIQREAIRYVLHGQKLDSLLTKNE